MVVMEALVVHLPLCTLRAGVRTLRSMKSVLLWVGGHWVSASLSYVLPVLQRLES